MEKEKVAAELTGDDLIRELYIEDIEDYCNVTFDRKNLPAGILLAVQKCMAYDPKNYGVSSEKISDMSKTYESRADVEKDIKSGLSKYARPHLVGDKRKRPYKSGR